MQTFTCCPKVSLPKAGSREPREEFHIDGIKQEITGHRFTGFGAHHSDYPCTYLTAAAALGITKLDVDSFIRRLDKMFTKKMMTAAAGQTADAMATLTVNDSEVCSVAAAVSDSQDHEQPDNDDDVASLQRDSTAGDGDVTGASI